MVGATAFQAGSCWRVTCDSKLAVESERLESGNSGCRSPNVARITERRIIATTSSRDVGVMEAEHVPIDRGGLLGHSFDAEILPHEQARGVGQAACSERVTK